MPKTITVTRALAELKLLDGRIRKKIEQGLFIDIGQQKADRALAAGTTKNEFQTKASADFKSIEDLIARRKNIKEKVLESNANTGVMIGGSSMTVAEAIERKNSIEYEKLILQKMEQQSRKVKNAVEEQRITLEEKVEDMLKSSLGSEATSKKEDYDTIAKPFLENNMYKELDPINIEAQIEKYDKRIDEFLSEVDFVLSESNAQTQIVVAD